MAYNPAAFGVSIDRVGWGAEEMGNEPTEGPGLFGRHMDLGRSSGGLCEDMGRRPGWHGLVDRNPRRICLHITCTEIEGSVEVRVVGLW